MSITRLINSLERGDVGVGSTDQGDSRGVDPEVLGSFKYEQGYQQGYLAAKQMLRDLPASVEGGVGAGNAGDSIIVRQKLLLLTRIGIGTLVATLPPMAPQFPEALLLRIPSVLWQ